MIPEFVPYPKMARLSRECYVLEKIDGTNASIHILDDGQFLVGSRNRWITPESDNYGFAKWAYGHKDELMTLGPGRHFGEWFGLGIQRGYGLSERRFSLFNVQRWVLYGETPQPIPTGNPKQVKMQEVLPPCVGLVPVLWRGVFSTPQVDVILEKLRQFGSVAAPGFPSPEGVVVWHTAANIGFKKTFDDNHKG